MAFFDHDNRISPFLKVSFTVIRDHFKITMTSCHSPKAPHLLGFDEYVLFDEKYGQPLKFTYENTGMAESIPEEILGMICNETEHTLDDGNATWRKYQKNLSLLSLTQVCKTWNSHLTNNVVLWTDIAFDVSEARSIGVAGLFLEMIEKLDVQFCVYAGFGEASDPKITSLLTKLRPLIFRIRHFQYTGSVEEYVQSLDLPADSLRHFIGKTDLVPFSGVMTTLRTLTTTPVLAPNRTAWICTLLNLTHLELEPPYLGQEIPFQPILNMIRNAPRITKLKLSCFRIFSDGAQLGERASLHHLELLELPYSDFQTVMNHLDIPNAREVTYHGSEYPPGYDTAAPIFRAPHVFANITSLLIYERKVKDMAAFTFAHGQISTFGMYLKTLDGFSLDIRMTWSMPSRTGWEEYVRNSLLGLEEHTSLSAEVSAGFFFWAPFSRPVRLPFLLSPHVEYLTIKGSIGGQVLRGLAMGSGVLCWFPGLRRLFITSEPLSPETGADALLSCLHARGHRLALYIKGDHIPRENLVRLGCGVEGAISHSLSCLRQLTQVTPLASESDPDYMMVVYAPASARTNMSTQ